jgi:hypothetical protein
MLSPTDIEKQVGSLIIGNLNPDGYLQVSVEELSRQSGISIEMVEDVLETMQSFDPVGVCARDLRECLLLQALLLELDNSLVIDIISDHLKHLENKNYKAICKALKAKLKDVVAAVNVIRALEPKPGRQFSEETPHYIIPDIYVYKSEGEFVIVLNDDGMPKLRVNPFYKRAITKKNEVSANAKEYIRDKMRSAAWLIRSIHQRQKTIYKVMESILKFQQGFFRKRRDPFKTHGPQGCRRRYRHARIHHQPGDDQQIRPHPPGHLRAQIFFQQFHQTGAWRGYRLGQRAGQNQKTDRRGKPKKTIQRQQNGRNAQNGQYRHCPPHGGQIPGNDGHFILQQTKAVLMAFPAVGPLVSRPTCFLNRQGRTWCRLTALCRQVFPKGGTLP